MPLCFFLLFLPAIWGQPAAVSPSPLSLASLSNQVEILHSGNQAWVPAQIGTDLRFGDLVRTGKNSSVEILYANDSILQFPENTTFEIQKSRLFYLRAGVLLGRIRSLFGQGIRFQIRTPTALVAVRGTQFAVSAESKSETSVGVFDEGRLEVESLNEQGSPSGSKVFLNPNQETVAKVGQPPLAPHPLAALLKYRANMRRLGIRLQALQSQRRRLLQKKQRQLLEKLRRRR